LINGLLPGNIPGWARFTREVNFHFILPADCVSGRTSRDRDVNRVAYYRLVFKRGSIRDVNRLCPEHLNLDTWVLRHPIDLAYVEGLFSVRMPSGDCLTKLFTAKVLCYPRPLLQVNFRFLKRKRHRYGGRRSTGALERFLRSKYGILADYSRQEVRHLSRTGRMRVVPQVPSWFRNFEVPHGLDVDYGPSLAYEGLRLLRSPALEHWSLFGSVWIAQTTAEYILTLCGSFKLFRLPDTLVEYIRLMDLSFVLGNKKTYQELLEHLDLVHRLDWTPVPDHNMEPWASREGPDMLSRRCNLHLVRPLHQEGTVRGGSPVSSHPWL